MSRLDNRIFIYFQKPRAIQTLLVLSDHPSKSLEELLALIGGSKSTGMKRIKELVHLGLVTKNASINEPKKVFYELNADGKRIANILKSIGDCCYED